MSLDVDDPRKTLRLLAELEIRRRYQPRKWAAEMMASYARFMALVMHRRAGKTVGAINYHIRAARNDEWEMKRLSLLEPSFTERDLKELLRGREYMHVLPTKIQAKEVGWKILKYYTMGIVGAKPNESDLSVAFPPTERNSLGSVVKLRGADDPDSLRGGGLSGCSLDEFSQIDPRTHSEVLSKALADHLGYTIYLGTLKGKNQLYRVWKAYKDDPRAFTIWRDVNESLALEEGPTVIALRLAMQDDRDQIAKGLMSQEEYDQEWFLSVVAAIKGAYYSKQIAEAERTKRVGHYPLDPTQPVYDVWDLGAGPQLVVGLFQRQGLNVRLGATLFGSESEGMPQMIQRLQQLGQDRRLIWGRHFAPHDINATDIGTGKKRIDQAKELGWEFDIVPAPRTRRSDIITDGIEMARALFGRLYVHEPENEGFIDAIGSYQQGWDKRNGVFTGAPVHNWASHPADMLRYAAQAEEDMVPKALAASVVRIPSFETHRGW